MLVKCITSPLYVAYDNEFLLSELKRTFRRRLNSIGFKSRVRSSSPVNRATVAAATFGPISLTSVTIERIIIMARTIMLKAHHITAF